MPYPGQTCSTCVWWQAEGPRLANARRDPAAKAADGTCQVNPPVLAIGDQFPVSMFPETSAGRFCGRWSPAPGSGGGGGENILAFPAAPSANRLPA